MTRVAPHVFLLTALAAVGAQSPTHGSDAILAAVGADRLGPHGAFVDSDGTIQSRGARHLATFSAAGAEFALADGDVQTARLQLRFTGAHRGEVRLERDGNARPHLAGDLVRWQHGPVSETYMLQPNGFEQSFVFAELPAGDGDLVVEIAASGNVTAPATVRAAHQSLEWSLGERHAIRYGEAFAFDRRGERIDVATSYDGAGLITLTVPAAFVDDAVLPLCVDPAVSPVLVPGTPSDNETQPDVAYDPTTDLYLMVWRAVTTGGAMAIRGKVYDSQGVVVTPAFDVAPAAAFTDVREPAVCLCRSLVPGAFVVVWTQADTVTGATNIRARAVSVIGVPLSGSFQVNAVGTAVSTRPTIAGCGGAIVVAWQSRSAAGQDSIRLRDLYWLQSWNPAAVTLGGDRLVTTAPTGQLLRNPRLARCNAESTSGIPSWANRLVWERYYPTPAPGHADVWTASFWLYGPSSPLTFAHGPAVVPGADGVGVDEINPDIAAQASAWSGATDLTFLVAWQDAGNILAQRYVMSGPIGGTIAVRATPDYAAAPTIVAGQTEWTIGYLEQPFGTLLNIDVYAARLTQSGTVIANHLLLDDPGAVLQSGLRATQQPLPVAGQNLRNTAMFVWSGATGPGSGPYDIRARLFEPVAGQLSPWGFPCAGPGGSLPTISTYGGLPSPGNDRFGVMLSAAPPVSLAALLIGTNPIGVAIPGTTGCTLYTDVPFVAILPTATNAGGVGAIDLPIPLGTPPLPFQLQWAVYTPGWNPFGWITSDDVDVWFWQ